MNAPHDKEFVFHDGTRAKNLLDIVSKLENMPDHTFHHFVNHHKNDFANWVDHVFSDKHFADKLRTTDSRSETIELIKDRISETVIGAVPIGGLFVRESKEDLTEEHHIKEHDRTIHHSEQKSEEKPLHTKEQEAHQHVDIQSSILSEVSAKEKVAEKNMHGKKWSKFFSKKEKKGVDEKKLEKTALTEEKRYMSENELKEELMSDEKENTLWVLLYFVLILLIISLLVYKLFL